ncbi:MAG: type II secretion system F family protein [Candidatus Paceibacterota bacterium]|jgi:type IV pilus assembly protein PilC
MSLLSYKARTIKGETKSGKLVAKDKNELAKMLRAQNLILVSVDEENKGAGMQIKMPHFFRRVKAMDRMLFTRHLGIMLKAGLSFSRALTVLSEQTGNAYFKEVLEKVQDDVQKGSQLGESLEKHPKAFDELFVNMIKVGETGGNLEEVLDLLYVQIKKSNELTSRVKGAMMYPAVIIFAMSVVGALMMTFVLPSILSIFRDMDVPLPLPTKILIFISDTIQKHGVLLLIGIIAFFSILISIIRTPRGKKGFDYILLRLPTIKTIIMKINMARFCRTLSSMIASGVSIVKALEIVSRILGNTYYREAVGKASASVQKGTTLSEFFTQYPKLFHPMMVHMVEVGEETGTLEETLKQVAEFYEEDVEQVTENMSAIIEPILMLVIGAAVGVFAVAIIQPMYGIMGKM